MAAIHPSSLLLVLLLLVSVQWSSATNYTVGDALGWTTRVDYSSWTVGKTFFVGDNLLFNYPPGIGTVNEVSAGEYIACSAINYKSTDSSGVTVITLTVGGPHYFICSIPGHCTDGMKLFVTVQPPTGTNMPGDSFFPTSNDIPFPTSNDIPFMPSAATGILLSASCAVLFSTGMVVLLKQCFF